jgi:hypothetical protein
LERGYFNIKFKSGPHPSTGENRLMVTKILKIILIVLVVVFVLAQFVRPEFSNPPVVQSDTLWAAAQVPDDVKQVFVRSCADCHSNETRYPWYSQITPSNWFLAGHVDEGRHELNFSTWQTYKPETQKRKLGEICEQVEGRSMPLPSYLWIHRDAALSDSETKLLCDWANSQVDKMDAKQTDPE